MNETKFLLIITHRLGVILLDFIVVTRNCTQIYDNSICKQHHRLKETIDGIPTETYECSCEGDWCNATSRLQITPIMMAVLMLMTVVMARRI